MRIHPYTLPEYQQLISVSLGQDPASVWFKNAQFLNIYTGRVERSHIYVSGRRIAYVGNKQLEYDAKTSVVELNSECIVVPGYIESHTHPCQMYNPLTWGEALTKQGTTTSINDNLTLMMLIGQKSIDFIDNLDTLGSHLWLWWLTFDSRKVDITKQPQILEAWLSHPLVIQGGEFTAWASFLKGNTDLLKAMFTIKQRFDKRVEGHLPGASIETLNALAAAGIGADHESLDGDDVIKRLRIGLYAAIRYSSIRPDLPSIIRSIATNAELNLSRLMLTSDGPAPSFVDQSSCANMIKLAMQSGISQIDAYRMATLNPATYYHLDEDLGGIAPGRLACFNILRSLDEPVPVHVMHEGRWIVREGRFLKAESRHSLDAWLQKTFLPKTNNIVISEDLIEDNINIGINIINQVITNPYSFSPGTQLEMDENFLALIDNDGKWRVVTRIKRFSTGVLGLASTYSASTDIIVLGRDKASMCLALSEVLELGGGIVVLFEDDTRFILPLPLRGVMSLQSIEDLGQQTTEFTRAMRSHGYLHDDPAYTLLFLTATHLPFIRLVESGVFLVKEQRIISP